MTKVSFFYGTPDRWRSALAWLADAWRARRAVVVYHPDADQRRRFDHLMWSQPATGFLPHCDAQSPAAHETPILLCGDLASIDGNDAVLNLSDDIPAGFTRFDHLIEFISTEEPVRLAGRERFKHYRERGYAIESTDLGTLAA